MLKILVVVMIVVIAPRLALAATPADERSAQALCARALRSINTLIDFTRTDCTPSRDGGGLALIFISLDRVFADERSKKAYLIVLVGAAGSELNASPKAPITSVSFMDKHLGLKRVYFTIPAKEAARLQREIKADRLTLDGFYRGILAAGTFRPVAK